MRFFKKSTVRTDPLEPEDSPSRDDDIEEGRTRGVKLPPARKNLIDFPPQWRERQGLIVGWTIYSRVTCLLGGILCPVGLCLSIYGGGLYSCQCCQPRGPGAGMFTALLIYLFAFFGFVLDLMGAAILVALGVYYNFAECPYKDSICDWRTMIALVLWCSAGFVFVRFIFSLNVFLSMRDYRREIHRERRFEAFLKQETEARFKQYSKQKHKRRQREEEEEV